MIEKRTFLRSWLIEVNFSIAHLQKGINEVEIQDIRGAEPYYDLDVQLRWRGSYKKLWELQRQRELILKEIEAAPPTKEEIAAQTRAADEISKIERGQTESWRHD